MPVLTSDANPGTAAWASTLDDVTDVSSADNAIGNTVDLTVTSGTPISTGTSGDLILETADVAGAGVSGDINITPGSTVGGTAGSTLVSGLRSVALVTAGQILGATTLVAADSGGVFTISQATGYTVVLPDPTITGMKFNFMVDVPGGNTVVINTPAGSIEGSLVLDASVVVATGTNINFLTGAALIGDNLELHSVGGIWFARGVSSAAAGMSAT
jgi:hypothetical protein